ncbi:hypothetical protein KVP09_01445 [Alcaligenaceae bacterium CGII-47]|nr:hypothetical protein [Alcaligenaceae bacterium CGII-47]
MKWKSLRTRVPEGLACAMCLLGVTWAQAPDQLPTADPEAWEVQSVRELMQRDIERSLNQARRQMDQPSVVVDSPVGRQLPRLVAMYGVGRSLIAEVLVGSRAFLYMRGQVHPVGYVNDQEVYQLRGMNGSCIVLQKAQHSHSLCLHALLGSRLP